MKSITFPTLFLFAIGSNLFAFENANLETKRGYALIEEIQFYEKLILEDKGKEHYYYISDVVFLIDRTPSWIGLMDIDTDIRYGIMRMFSWIAQLETQTLRQSIKNYLYQDPYISKMNNEILQKAKNNGLDPLDIKKELKIYALLRVLFNIPDDVTLSKNIPAYNFLSHGRGSYNPKSKINNPTYLIWPFSLNPEGQLELTGDYAFHDWPQYDYKKNLLLSFDYLNQKYGRRIVSPLEIK